jgi:hypothetical protein
VTLQPSPSSKALTCSACHRAKRLSRVAITMAGAEVKDTVDFSVKRFHLKMKPVGNF